MSASTNPFTVVADLLNPLAADARALAEKRCSDQWQAANSLLTLAMAKLANDDQQGAIANALTGILALQLSKT